MVLALPAPQSFADSSVDAQGYIAFHDTDSDHNGYVSRVEAHPVVAENAFDSADANRDGLLDSGEYMSIRSVRKAD